jgi:hypothetical protein
MFHHLYNQPIKIACIIYLLICQLQYFFKRQMFYRNSILFMHFLRFAIDELQL